MLNNLNSQWISGEYKWMSTSVIEMPIGWKKVNLKTGFTLVQGTKEGTTTGEVKYHNHLVAVSTRKRRIWW